MSVNLESVINISKLKILLDSFSELVGVASSVVDLDGRIIMRSGWQDICTSFHSKNPEAAKLCAAENLRVCADLLEGESYICFQCPHGLFDVASQITIDNVHIANLFAGQFFTNIPDQTIIDRFRKQAVKWGFDEDEYIKAFYKIPVIPENKIKSVVSFMTKLSEIIGELASIVMREQEKERSIQKAYADLNNEIRQRMEEAEKLNQIIEGNAIPTYVIDLNSRITHWNKACELLTGVPASEMIGSDRHQEIFYGVRRPLAVDFIVENKSPAEIGMIYGGMVRPSLLVNSGYEGEYLFPKLGHNGRILFFTAAPLRDSKGNIKGAIGTIQDVTEKREAEMVLRSSEERYRHLFDSANDAIFLLKDAIFIDCNKRAMELLRCGRSDIVGKKPTDISPEFQSDGKRSAERSMMAEAVVLSIGRYFFEWRFLRKDGLMIDAEISSTKINVSGYPCHLAIVRDITERKSFIEALKQREMELDEKTRYLEKVNQALKASLDHREVERRSVEENILINLKRSVFPYIADMARSKINADARAYLSIIETNLKEIVSPFSKALFSKYINLTPTEIKIADFIRDGRNTKEIAVLLGLSPSSVQWHRKNIREKLEITNKKTNLYTYLKTLS